MRAVRLLRRMGYTSVRAYDGGLEDWKAAGLPVESGERRLPAPAPRPSRRVPDRIGRALDALASRTTRELLGVWAGMVVVFGVVFASLEGFPAHGLAASGHPVDVGSTGVLTAIYFSFVTALSIGYGDVVPMGLSRVLAIVEGASGLLLFGTIVSKLVSTRQEALTEEIHRIAFEDRLGRVRTNLHLVLSELQTIPRLCEDTREADRVLARIESAAAVYVGELKIVHELLFRPEQMPDEAVLEGILASLAASLREFVDLQRCLSEARRDSTPLRSSMASVGRLAGEICGDCVPRQYAADLKEWMDRVQSLARTIR